MQSPQGDGNNSVLVIDSNGRIFEKCSPRKGTETFTINIPCHSSVNIWEMQSPQGDGNSGFPEVIHDDGTLIWEMQSPQGDGNN